MTNSDGQGIGRISLQRAFQPQQCLDHMLDLGFVCTAFAYVLYFRLLADIGPIKASTTTFLIPPFGVLWGALLLCEPLSWAYLYGGVLIALALWLVVRPTSTQVKV